MKNRASVILAIVLLAAAGFALGQQEQAVILAQGKTPLTEQMVSQLYEFFEWSLEISLSPGQRQLVRQSTISTWNRKDQGEIDGTLSILDLQEKVGKADPESRIAARQKLLPDLMKMLEAGRGEEMCAMLLSAYQSARDRRGTPVDRNSSGEETIFPIVGEPPLTRGLVDRGVRLFEWLLDARLTEEQYKTYEDGLVTAWRSKNQAVIAATLDVLRIQDDLGKKARAERDAVREAFCSRYLEQMRQTPDSPEAQWALGIYYSAHTPIAKGDPPLTRQAADAYAEVMSFMINEVVGGQVLVADKEYKDKLANSLAAQYTGLNSDRQKEFSQMPIAWAGIRMTWPTLSAAQKAQYRQQWTPAVRALLPPAPVEMNDPPPNSNMQGMPAGRSKQTNSNRQKILADYRHHLKTRQWLFNLNQDFIHEHILSPGWTYQKYSW